jgi:hypothetical protein
VPNQIEITTPQRQEGDEDVTAPRTPVQTPQVYTAGTYVQTLEDHHLNQQTSGQLNFLSCHNQIIGQQGNQVTQEFQTLMDSNLM